MEIINFALKGENMTSDNKKEPVMTWLSRLEESEGAEVGESMSKIINMASRSPDVDGGWIVRNPKRCEEAREWAHPYIWTLLHRLRDAGWVCNVAWDKGSKSLSFEQAPPA